MVYVERMGIERVLSLDIAGTPDDPLGQRLSAPIPGGRPREEIHARILRRGGGYVPSPQRADHPDAWPISSWGSRVDVRV